MRTAASRIMALAAVFVMCWPATVPAQSQSDIQQQIDDHNTQIAQLDREIAQFQVQLDVVAGKKKTLQNTLSQLDLSLKKSAASINATKKKIGATQLEIQKLSHGIADKQEAINTDEAGLGESFRRLNEMENEPLVVQILSSNDLSVAWSDMDAHQSLQGAINQQINDLSTQKESLTDIKKNTEAKRAQLLQQQNTLLAQQGELNAQKKAQAELLAQTKSQESTYQAILAEKVAGKAAYEAALNDLKAQFLQNVDPTQVPAARKGILRWPLDKIRITQTFGQSAFAQSGAYNGKGHNGIDLGVPLGTPVKAALSGIVIGTGNTDLYRGCYSAGKWIMIKHNNGLSTMYGHLSQIGVSEGQSVVTGQIIGNVGATGYATGPHLHLSVYVTSVTKITTFGEATNKVTACAKAKIPITPPAGFLNPLSYLS